MYICLECHAIFENPKDLTESHSLTTPPYEHLTVCPKCLSTDIKNQEVKYCKCCGARLNSSQENYCSKSCQIKEQKLRIQEMKKYKSLRQSYIYITVRNLEEYNHENNTRLSYGQYVALTENKKGRRKNGKK